MFTKKTYADIKKSTLKFQDYKKDSITRLKHLKTILDFVDVKGAKSLFERNYSHVYFILYDTFIQAEVNLKHKDLPFQIAHKAHREELDASLWLLKKILLLLPELLARRWQCHSISRIMAKLLHLGNSPWLRKEGVRYFVLWYQVLAENAPNYVHEMFADLFPGLIVPQKGISVPDGEFDTSDVFSHPNMKVEAGTSVFHDMMLHPVQSSETVALSPPTANDRTGPLDPKDGLEIFLNCIVQSTGSIKWRDSCTQKDCKSFVFLLNRFKEVFLPVFCPDFDTTNTIYEPKLDLPKMRTMNKKDEVMSSCIVVLINWISRFVHEKMLNSKLENICLQYTDRTLLISDHKSKLYLQEKIVREALYSTRSNINFLHEILRQGFLLSFTTKSQIEAIRTSVAVYRDWMRIKNPPQFMLEPDEGDSNSTSSSSMNSSLQNQKLKSKPSIADVNRSNKGIQAGLQNVIQVFVTNAANVFLLNTSNLNIVFPSSNREFQSTPLNEQTDICKKVLNVYRTMVMNTRMEPKTWEQLLLVLLQVTSIVLNQNSVGSRQALGNRLGQAIFQTLIVTWIRAHTNVPINVQLWERFLTVLSSLTSKDALINEWEKTMQTLTRVLGRYVYNLNLQDLPLDRLTVTKGKRRRIASVWQSDSKERSSRSSHAENERNEENSKELQKKEEEYNPESAGRIIRNNSTLIRCYSEGNLASSRKTDLRANHEKRTILVKPLSFEHSLSALLDQTNVHLSFEKIHFRNEDSINLPKKGMLRRAISLNSFHLKNSCYSNRHRDGDSLHDSRSPSPSASSGIDGGSIKYSPMQIDPLVNDTADFEDNTWVTSSERRSIILGGYVSGWLPGTAAIMWKRMLGSLGDINFISRPEVHAQVFKHLVEMTRNLIKLMHNQGVSEDNLSTPTPPSLVPPIGISSPWCYGAQLLSAEYKKGQLLALKILCMLAINGSIEGRNHMPLFYNLLHKVLTGEDRQGISCLFKFLDGTRFLSLQLPGHTLLLLDIVHASAVLLTSNDPNSGSPRGEVVTLLGSLLCYPTSVTPKPVLQPSMQKIELMECADLHDHILNIMLRCARREPSSKGRCIAFSQLGQWIYLELNRSNEVETQLKSTIPQYSPQTGDVMHSMRLNPRIKEVIQVLLQALHFKHRTIAVVAAGSLKICCEQSRKLSGIDNLPQLIITTLCKALEGQHVLNPQESDRVALSTLMMCLGEFCLSLPAHFMLDSIYKDDSLIIVVLRVLFHILSGERTNSFKLLNTDSDFDENIIIDDVIVGNISTEANYQKSRTIDRNKLSIRLCAKSMIMHLVAHLGLFPPMIGASRLSSLVEEQDDIYLPKLDDYRETIKDSANCILAQGHQPQSIEVFILNSGLIASFIELPDLKLHAGGVFSDLSTAEKQVRVLLRDLNGKSCWEASMLYSKPRKLQQNFMFAQNFLQSNKRKQSLTHEYEPLVHSLTPLSKDIPTSSRHTIRHRPFNKLPIASDLASDLDQLGDLLRYVGHISPECLINSSTQLNTPGISPLGCELEAQTISILLNQRSVEHEYKTNLHHSENEIEYEDPLLSHQTSGQFFESCNTINMYKSKYSFHLCRLLFCHLGLIGWERRSRTHLLQRSEKLKRELRNVDTQKCRDTHKVAVVYVASGQEDKNSILKNTNGSSAYECFVSALGWEIDLETHNGFLGGLPRQGCGITAPYYATPFVEVIYHTATRMPSDTPEDLLTKTRHLGNDEVHIVWSEHNREYRRDILPTEFCDVLIVVYPLKNCLFRVTVNWKPDVPWFGPLANESVVNGSCLAILVRETAINASRSKRSSLSLYQQYYEERHRSLENVSMLYKEHSTFEDFANRVYSTNPVTLSESTSDRLSASLIDKHREKGGGQTVLEPTSRDSAHSSLPDESSPRVPRRNHSLKPSLKETTSHQTNMQHESTTFFEE